MTPIQKKVFQMLQIFTQICDRLQLKYFLVCGSALGAVKYGGFVPWDDDVDVALFRDDYERFCKEAPALLPEQLFLQNFQSDPAFPAIYSKLRNSETTCIEESVAVLPINHGISLDIFPLDGYPKDKKEQERLERKKAWFVRKLSIPCVRPERWKEAVVNPLRALGFGINNPQKSIGFEPYLLEEFLTKVVEAYEKEKNRSIGMYSSSSASGRFSFWVHPIEVG